jgi:hypothetical protein
VALAEGHRADVRAVPLDIEHGLSRGGDPRVAGRASKGRGEVRARTISASSAPDVLRSGRCRPTSNGSVTGTSAVPFQASCCPAAIPEMATSSSSPIEALAGCGSRYQQPGHWTRHRKHAASSSDDRRRRLGLPRHFDRDALVREIQELEGAAPDCRHLDRDHGRGRGRSFGDHDEDVPAELARRQVAGIAVIEFDRQPFGERSI